MRIIITVSNGMTKKCSYCNKTIKGKALKLRFNNPNAITFYLCSENCYKKQSGWEMRNIVMFDMS